MLLFLSYPFFFKLWPSHTCMGYIVTIFTLLLTHVSPSPLLSLILKHWLAFFHYLPFPPQTNPSSHPSLQNPQKYYLFSVSHVLSVPKSTPVGLSPPPLPQYAEWWPHWWFQATSSQSTCFGLLALSIRLFTSTSVMCFLFLESTIQLWLCYVDPASTLLFSLL